MLATAGCATGVGVPDAAPTGQALQALPTPDVTWSPADLDLGPGLPSSQPSATPPPVSTGPFPAATSTPAGAVARAAGLATDAWWERRGAAALATIGHPWERYGYTIEFLPPRRGLKGMIHPAERRIEVYVRADDPLDVVASTIAHEIGHALDLTHGSDARRARWLELRGAPADTPWFTCDGCDDLSVGAGDFAEVFALWLVGPADFRSRVAGPPDRGFLEEHLVPLFAPEWQPPESEPTGTPEPSPSPQRRGLVRCLFGCD